MRERSPSPSWVRSADLPAVRDGGGEPFALETPPADSDSRNERIGTFVESHHVGEPMTTRS